jgi:hypothetical protein
MLFSHLIRHLTSRPYRKGRELADAVRKVLEKHNYAVLPMGKELADIAGPISEAPGIDMVVAAGGSSARVTALVDKVRADGKLGASPLLALTSTDVYNDLRAHFEKDSSTAVRPIAMGDEMISREIDELVLRSTGGGITAEEAKGYQARALTALRDIAMTRSEVFSAVDAVAPLITVLGRPGVNKLDVAEILSRTNFAKAQVAIMDAALNSTGSDQPAMLDKVTASVKRFGSQLEPRQVTRAIDLAKSGDTSAAALVGAMGIENKDVVKLIVGTDAR